MDFRTRRIRKEPRIKQRKSEVAGKPVSEPASTESPSRQERDPQTPSRLGQNVHFHLLAIGGGLLFILLILFGMYQIIRSLDFSAIVFSFGKPLITDEYGNTNILLVGVGGEGHEGTDLTDTVMIASVDYDKKIVPMISIPRDFYMEKGDMAQMRINAVYHTAKGLYGDKEALYKLKEKVSEITGVEIQYYVKVDFQGFTKIVDSIGGVDVLVENAIYDPYYPKGETIYFETFQIDEGLQHLDGETALKYARSRKTTSDFDRAKRQQQLLYAIKEKALSLNILTDSGKIKELYDGIGDSIETNLSLAEILELGKLAKDMQRESILPLVINDDPTSCGGLVYTPAREFFSGASVLLPAGNNFEYVHFFIGTVLQNVEPISDKVEIQVLNGTKVPGLAYEGMNLLSRFCLNVVYYGNASNRELQESTVYYKSVEPGTQESSRELTTIEMIKTLMPGVKIQAGIPPEYLESEKQKNTTIVVELGEDYRKNRLVDPFDSLRYFVPPPVSTQQTAETTTSDSASDSTSDPASGNEATP